MSTNELEIKLKISENTGIHCPTLQLAKKVLDIFNDLGLKWCTNVSYIKCTNWDNYENNTVYYPTAGTFSSLQFAQEEGYKIISAEKFIASHAEEFDLKNYEPKGELIGFPKEIIARMLECQEEQGNKRYVIVFEEYKFPFLEEGGFDWDKTKEKFKFWDEVIYNRNFDLFFERYPKQGNQDNSQEFKVGDEVIDIIRGRIGKIIDINTLTKDSYPISVEFNDNEVISFTLDGRDYIRDKYPRLLHHRDDYNYDVIDFNNLPQRQEYKRWRAEVGGIYYFIKRDDYDSELDRVCENKDYYSYISNEQYKIGNYFQIKEEAQEVVDKLNRYFKQLIKEEHEHERNKI